MPIKPNLNPHCIIGISHLMTIHAPVLDFAAARASMVDTQLRPEGVNYPPVSEAMAAADAVTISGTPLNRSDIALPPFRRFRRAG